ncbi:hypothetical protein ACLKA6_016689 [Drosophila palustris]
MKEAAGAFGWTSGQMDKCFGLDWLLCCSDFDSDSVSDSESLGLTAGNANDNDSDIDEDVLLPHSGSSEGLAEMEMEPEPEVQHLLTEKKDMNEDMNEETEAQCIHLWIALHWNQ